MVEKIGFNFDGLIISASNVCFVIWLC
jgi:hypothetical protein